jgi:hypothetical protein
LRALLYSKPLALVPSVAPLLRELQLRSPSSRAVASGGQTASGEASNVGLLVDECAAAWVSFRMGVLGAVVGAEIARLDPSRGDLVDLVRSPPLFAAPRRTSADIFTGRDQTRAGCGYLKQLCSDEFQLFRQFFATGGEDALLCVA